MEAEPIVCRQLSKVFCDFWFRPRVRAVEGLDLTVQRGEVFGLLGPNGSGKSTAIKLILGLLHPTAGQLRVFGLSPHDRAVKSRVGFLPEETYLYRFLDAGETLHFFGRLFGLDKAERRRRIAMLLEMVGLEGAGRRPVGEFSKGMQRRIGLAQALINDPDLLILDEPTSGLDPVGTRQIKDLILHLRARGKTVLLSSHLLADVEDLCDRVAVLYGGKIRAEGTVNGLLTEKDATLFRTGPLDGEARERAAQALAQAAGTPVLSVQAPKKKLESLFLEIISQAHEEGADTSGARSGGRIASFLAQDETPEEQGRRVLNELLEPALPTQAGPGGAALRLSGLKEAALGEPAMPASPVGPGRREYPPGPESGGDPAAVPVAPSLPSATLPPDQGLIAAMVGTVQERPKPEGSKDHPDRGFPPEKEAGEAVDRELIEKLMKKGPPPQSPSHPG
jgi:ABC-2 type transport system ATP-binding protein